MPTSSIKCLVHASDTVSANKLVTFNVPSFETVLGLNLNFTNSGAAATLANIKSSITNIQVLCNGEQIINVSPTDLDNVWTSLGTEVSGSLTNVLPLMICHLCYKNPEYERIFAIGCEGYDKDGNGKYNKLTNLQVKVQCGGTVTGITDVEVQSERIDYGTGNNVTQAIAKLLTYTQSFASTGLSTVDTLPRDTNEGYLFVHANNGGGVISSGECLINNVPVVQPISKNSMDLIVQKRGFGAVSSVFNYCFVDGDRSNLLSMVGVTDLRFKTTFTTAPTSGLYNLVAASVRVV